MYISLSFILLLFAFLFVGNIFFTVYLPAKDAIQAEKSNKSKGL